MRRVVIRRGEEHNQKGRGLLKLTSEGYYSQQQWCRIDRALGGKIGGVLPRAKRQDSVLKGKNGDHAHRQGNIRRAFEDNRAAGGKRTPSQRNLRSGHNQREKKNRHLGTILKRPSLFDLRKQRVTSTPLLLLLRDEAT